MEGKNKQTERWGVYEQTSRNNQTKRLIQLLDNPSPM